MAFLLSFQSQILSASAKLGLLGDLSSLSVACDNFHDLPLYPRLHPASRHDSVSFVTGSIEFVQHFSLGTIDKFHLDAAHDAESIYELLEHQGVEAFIDLNPRTKHNFSSESDIQISPKGIPICPIGKEMKPNGYDKSQNRQKFLSFSSNK